MHSGTKSTCSRMKTFHHLVGLFQEMFGSTHEIMLPPHAHIPNKTHAIANNRGRFILTKSFCKCFMLGLGVQLFLCMSCFSCYRRGDLPQGEAVGVRHGGQGAHHRLDRRATQEPASKDGNAEQLVRDIR